MDTAKVFAELSQARRLHVGAIVVKDDRIISIGYNGMPAGWDNNCENREYMSGDNWDSQLYPFEEEETHVDADEGFFRTTRRYRLKTKPEVLHAETNAIAKLAKSTESGLGASMFITHAPCLDCAKLIYQSGINTVYYREAYRDNSGVEFLKNSGVVVTQS